MTGFLAAILLVRISLAQSVQLVPDPGAAEEEYLDAEEAWLRSDPNLEKDLFKADREELRARIARAAKLRDTVIDKRATYLDFMIQRVDNISGRTFDGKGPTIPVQELKTRLEDEQNRLLAEQDRLEMRMRDLPPGDEYVLVRRAMEDERTTLINLQNNVALRIHGLGNLQVVQAAESDAESRDPLSSHFAELKKIWVEEKDHTVQSRSKWARYYKELERAVDASPANGDSDHKGKKKKSAEVHGNG